LAPTDQQTEIPAGALQTPTPLGIQVAPGAWMRKRGIGTLLLVAYAGVFSVAFATGGVAILFGLGSGGPLGAMLAVDLICWGVAALAIRFAVRMALAGLRISSSEVCLRGVLRTHTFPLSGVEGFAPAAYPGGALRSEVGVKLMQREGHDLRVWAMRKGAPSGKKGLKEAKDGFQPLCEELNRLLQTMRGDTIDSATPS
jgi:hypothetical protein